MHPAALSLLAACAAWALWLAIWFAEADVAVTAKQRPRRVSPRIPILITIACIAYALIYHP